MRRSSSYREELLESLRDPIEAAAYLNAAMEDSPEMFRKACLNVVQARQTPVAEVAREVGVTRESLYRSFSADGKPAHDTVQSVLAAVGLKFRVERVEAENTTPPKSDLGTVAREKVKAALENVSKVFGYSSTAGVGFGSGHLVPLGVIARYGVSQTKPTEAETTHLFPRGQEQLEESELITSKLGNPVNPEPLYYQGIPAHIAAHNLNTTGTR